MKFLTSRFGAFEWVAVIVLLAIVSFAAAPQLIAPFDPLRTGAGRPLLSPHWGYIFGTDELGRDVFSRVVWGARISLAIAVGSTLIALIAGSMFGSVMAIGRGGLGAGVTFVVNLVLVFPGVILAIALATILGPGSLTTAIVLSVLYTPPIARLVSATIQSEYGKSYVSALKVAGAGSYFILTRAVGKAVAAVVLTFALVIIADAILLEAALSFIGIGVPAPTPSWGNIVSGGRNLMTSGRGWVATSGGLAIVLFALAINILGDAFGNRIQKLPRAKATPSLKTATPPNGSLRLVENPQDAPILVVRDLQIRMQEHYGDVAIVDAARLDIHRGEVLALVGESGSGKSLMAQAVLGLLPRGALASGSVVFDGREILGESEKALQEIRGRKLAFLPQDSIASLNPLLKISTQIQMVCCQSGSQKPEDLLEQVRLPARRILSAYPHELSGGQCQRIALAMALARRPNLLIADEPTTALDVSVQAEIFEVINELRGDLGFSMLLITHDLALVASTANRIAVSYGGCIVETGPAGATLSKPKHPYTAGLLRSIRSMELRDDSLYSIDGTVPNPREFPSGCRFAGRCPRELGVCATIRPPLTQQSLGTFACHNPSSPKSGEAA